MTIALAAVGAALATLLLTLLVLWLRQRGRTREAELAEALRELESRMDTMVRELTDTIERTQHEGQRTRMLGELAGSIDLDEVLNRVLEAAGAIEGVDAALITVATPPGGEPIVATLGLSAEEAQRQAVLGPPDGREARAISMSYEYGALEADEEAIRSGVAVPLPGETAHLGLLTIFTRAAQPTFGESQVSELEQLALRAGPAIENARRFREARQLADLLPESRLRDADQLYARLRTALSSKPVGQAGPLTMSAGVAELQPDDDAIAFFQRADHALYGAKEAGKGQVVAASLVQPQPPANMPPTIASVPPPEEPPTNLNTAG